MTFQLFILLFLLSFIAFYLNKRRIAVLFSLFGFLFVFIIGSGILPRVLLEKLQSQVPMADPIWKRSNAIVLLGAGVVQWPKPYKPSSSIFGHSRVHEAARLYFSCMSQKKECRILVTGGDPKKYGVTEAEVLLGELKDIGVPEINVLLESKSNNTFQNAQFSSELLKSKSFEQIILVTSGIHGRRSQAYFSRFIDKTSVAPSDRLTAIPSILPLSYNFTVTDFALHEYVGLLRFAVYNRLGLNPSSHKPGAP